MPQVVLDVAAELGVDPDRLDHHVEAEHGFEPHDQGYAQAVRAAAYCVASGVCVAVGCTCGRTPHRVDCARVAADQPHAMATADGDVFYPDDLDAAAYFTTEHHARFVNPQGAAGWAAAQSDTAVVTRQAVLAPLTLPAPTTGGPVMNDRPEGCVCTISEDIDWGEVYRHPPGGCRVHTPWAFPGYSLAAIANGYL